jgi:putative ABC transport system permease protein
MVIHMTWIGLVRKNLMRRPMRTLLTAAGVAIGVGLIVALLSISEGAKRTAGDLIHIGRSDFGLFQSGVSDATRSLLPVSLEKRIDADPGVAESARVFLLVTKVQGMDSSLVFGLAPNEFPLQRMTLVAGDRSGALVGDAGAKTFHVHPGSTIDVNGHRFRVSGIYHSGDRFEDQGVVLPLATVQRLANRPGEVTTLAVTVKLGQTPQTVATRLEKRYGISAIVEPGQAVKVDTSSRLIIDVGWVVSVLALIVGGIGVMNTMAMSVFERIREIGILRAVGWPSRRIALLILSEALGISLVALAIGLVLGLLAAHFFTTQTGLSTLVSPHFTAGVFAWGLAFALGVGILGAIYPTWRALRLSPIEALRHE